MNRLAIIGGGSWGTALAIVLAPRFESVRFWVHQPELAERIAATRQNDVYLPGLNIPANVMPTAELKEAAAGASIVLGVMPSQHARRVYGEMLPFLSPEMRFVTATKGLENGTLLRMSQVMEAVLLERFHPRIAVLSGPTFAREIAAQEPAAVVISSRDTGLCGEIQTAFSSASFRLYANHDPIGVEVGAAVKNVIAIGAGICHGLGLGSNSVAALITRGLAEITRLAMAMGGESRTLAGLAGLGDLVLTCTGDLSRNRKLGMELAKGRTLHEIVSSMTMIAEGVHSTFAAMDLAKRFNVEMPITGQMYCILKEAKPPMEAIRELMERDLKKE